MKKVKIARCPYCQRLLFKYDYSCDLDISMRCPKCSKSLSIVTKGGLWE